MVSRTKMSTKLTGARSTRYFSLLCILFVFWGSPDLYSAGRATEPTCLDLAAPFAGAGAADASRKILMPKHLVGASTSSLASWAAERVRIASTDEVFVDQFSVAFGSDDAEASSALKGLLSSQFLDAPTRYALVARAKYLAERTGNGDLGLFAALQSVRFDGMFACQDCEYRKLSISPDLSLTGIENETVDLFIRDQNVENGAGGLAMLERGCKLELGSAAVELYKRSRRVGVPDRQQDPAIKALLLLAEKYGSLDATYYLSILEKPNSEMLRGFPQESIERLAYAASRGHSESQYRLATLLRKSDSLTPGDFQNIALLLENSANNGFSASAYGSYLLYELSPEPFRNQEHAMYWLLRAVALGSPTAKQALDEYHLKR